MWIRLPYVLTPNYIYWSMDDLQYKMTYIYFNIKFDITLDLKESCRDSVEQVHIVFTEPLLNFYIFIEQLSDQIRSVAQSCPTLCDPMNCSTPIPCPSPTPGVHSDSRPTSQWCHPAISSSVVPFSSCPQSLPVSESFPMSQLFAWGGQSTAVSALASFLPKKSQGWSPSEWTGWISL